MRVVLRVGDVDGPACPVLVTVGCVAAGYRIAPLDCTRMISARVLSCPAGPRAGWLWRACCFRVCPSPQTLNPDASLRLKC